MKSLQCNIQIQVVVDLSENNERHDAYLGGRDSFYTLNEPCGEIELSVSIFKPTWTKKNPENSRKHGNLNIYNSVTTGQSAEEDHAT